MAQQLHIEDLSTIERQENFCPVTATIECLSGKWKLFILYQLLDTPKRYGELKKLIPGISEKMLAQQLQQLQQDNLIHRQQFNEVPPHVEYSMTQKTENLKPILYALAHWGNKYLKD